MADDAVYDAIKAFLSTPSNVAGLADPDTAEVPPIRFENEAFTKPNPPAPWISVALTGVLYGQQSIGESVQADNRWDERGHLWLPVFVAAGAGASQPRRLAKKLADLFRGLTLLSGDLEFMDAFIGEGGPAEEEGNWYELPLAIEWRRVEA
ncbi:MAG: hypothetical protein KDK07_07960 [Bauldia sp.]|nr:hypothetical protein [Bauldia sp.]